MILEAAILSVKTGQEPAFEAAFTEGFRQSADYAEWKKRLHHFYDPFPTVEHYSQVL